LMKQAQQMQEKMNRAQEELGAIEVEGKAGNGAVCVVMSCRHEVRRVRIDPSLMGDADDREMLEDLIVTACNDALKQVEATTQAKMSGLTAGLPLPPGMKLPF
ncbi:MAG: YbaB/EbfC family nucleoid-associated protein, partial [Betaproteobacteria bacterium]|nr:YbaB/EbfC family nucleoid-associated protein [Betaproteobacteria bacterium]